MQRDYVRDLRFERFHGRAFAMLAPCLDVSSSELVARLIIEEGHGGGEV
jgi:hypothetical protein